MGESDLSYHTAVSYTHLDIFYNRILIDAKSILGVLSMDLNQVLTVKCHGESGDFDRVLAKFAVA